MSLRDFVPLVAEPPVFVMVKTVEKPDTELLKDGVEHGIRPNGFTRQDSFYYSFQNASEANPNIPEN